MIPNGSPATVPAGTARAARSSRFAKFVYVPSRALMPTGSSAHFGDRGVQRGRRGQQRVAAVQRVGGARREPVQPLPVREVIGRAVLRGVEDDRRDDRVKVAADEPGVLADVVADRRVPLGDERSAVQQARGLQQGRDVDGDDLGADRPQSRDGRLERLRPAVGQPGELGWQRDGDADVPGVGPLHRRCGAASRRAAGCRAGSPAGPRRRGPPSPRPPGGPAARTARTRSRSRATGTPAPRRCTG